MRTDELIRSLEARGQRDTTGVAADGAAERVVAEAHRSALRRHRAQRVAAGGVVAVVLVAVGVAGWQALDSRNEAVQVITSPDDPGSDGDVPSDEQLARPEMEARSAREAERARIEFVQREARVRELSAIPMVEHNGIGLRVPDGWYTSGENLTPSVSPHPIASFGTAPLPVGGGERCSQYPIAAVLAMSDDDVLVSLIEGASIRSPERGSSLWEMAALPNDAEIMDCPEWPAGFEPRWYPFADSGRGFYLLVVTGTDVSDTRMLDLAAAVDLIYVEPHYDLGSDGAPPEPPPSIPAPSSAPPYPLPNTGVIGHLMTVDGQSFLVGTSGTGRHRTVEIMIEDTTSDTFHYGTFERGQTRSPGNWGFFLDPVARVVIEVGDRRFEPEAVPLPFDPVVRLWALPPTEVIRPVDGEHYRVTFFDAEGNELP